MLSRLRAASFLAEFIGTAMLVMVVLVLSQTTPVSYFIATSVAITLAVIVMLFGTVSGAHVNPAITFGMWASRQIGTLRAANYVAAQLLGALAALQLYQYFTDRAVAVREDTFTTPIWLAEVVGTAVLALGITAAVSRGFDALQSALAYGAAFFVGIMIASTASAAFLNPAIALGVRGWSAAYVLGPLVGALVATNLYYLLFAPSTKPRAHL